MVINLNVCLAYSYSHNHFTHAVDIVGVYVYGLYHLLWLKGLSYKHCVSGETIVRAPLTDITCGLSKKLHIIWVAVENLIRHYLKSSEEGSVKIHRRFLQ